jgi:hypothetical protein
VLVSPFSDSLCRSKRASTYQSVPGSFYQNGNQRRFHGRPTIRRCDEMHHAGCRLDFEEQEVTCTFRILGTCQPPHAPAGKEIYTGAATRHNMDILTKPAYMALDAPSRRS